MIGLGFQCPRCKYRVLFTPDEISDRTNSEKMLNKMIGAVQHVHYEHGPEASLECLMALAKINEAIGGGSPERFLKERFQNAMKMKDKYIKDNEKLR
jgi:hypothetical protein